MKIKIPYIAMSTGDGCFKTEFCKTLKDAEEIEKWPDEQWGDGAAEPCAAEIEIEIDSLGNILSGVYTLESYIKEYE